MICEFLCALCGLMFQLLKLNPNRQAEKKSILNRRAQRGTENQSLANGLGSQGAADGDPYRLVADVTKENRFVICDFLCALCGLLFKVSKLNPNTRAEEKLF